MLFNSTFLCILTVTDLGLGFDLEDLTSGLGLALVRAVLEPMPAECGHC